MGAGSLDCMADSSRPGALGGNVGVLECPPRIKCRDPISVSLVTSFLDVSLQDCASGVSSRRGCAILAG
jgi:hypothetical protein